MASSQNLLYDATREVEITIDEILKIFSKMAKTLEEKNAINKLAEQLKDDTAIRCKISDTFMRKVMKELERENIPFYCYDVIGSTDGYMIFAKKDMERINNLINATKNRMGYFIDTKEELENALKATEMNPKLVEYSGLTPEVAERIMEKANKHSITVVKEKQEDQTYSVFCSNSNKENVNRFLYSSVWDLTGKSGERESLRLQYLLKEKEEVKDALTYANTEMKEAYVFSTTNKNMFLHIQPDGYEIFKDNSITVKMKQAQNPEEYEELLAHKINELEGNIYMTAEEVQQKGGPFSETIKNDITAATFISHGTREDGLTIQAEKEVRNWLENKFNIGSNQSLVELKRNIESVNLNDFKNQFVSTKSNDPALNDKYKEMVVSHLDKCEKHFSDTARMLKAIEIKTHMLKRTIEQTIEICDKEAQKENLIEKTQEKTSSLTTYEK